MTELKELDQTRTTTPHQSTSPRQFGEFKQLYDQASNLDLILDLKTDLAPDSHPYTLEPSLEDEDLIKSQNDGIAILPQPPIPPSVFELAALNSLAVDQTAPIGAIAQSQPVIDLMTVLGEFMGLLSHTIQAKGVSQTSCVIDKPGSVLDQVTLVLSAFDTAPFEYQLEITSCDKLQALLHNHQGALITHLAHAAQPLKLSRFEVNGQSLSLKKDKIEGSLFKKVAQVT
jgi:hypothetical protein